MHVGFVGWRVAARFRNLPVGLSRHLVRLGRNASLCFLSINRLDGRTQWGEGGLCCGMKEKVDE